MDNEIWKYLLKVWKMNVTNTVVVSNQKEDFLMYDCIKPFLPLFKLQKSLLFVTKRNF